MNANRTIAALAFGLSLAGCSILVGPNPDFIAEEGGESESSSEDTDEGDEGPAPPPDHIPVYTLGNLDDAEVVPEGPGLVLLGGDDNEVPMGEPGPGALDEAFTWQRDRISGGDVVVLQIADNDDLNAYLYEEIGGADSVQTIVLATRAAASDPWVSNAVALAEGVVLVNEDPGAVYEVWAGTPMLTAVEQAWAGGAIVTTIHAGILGDALLASRVVVDPSALLGDPFHPQVNIQGQILSLPVLDNTVILDRFRQDDAMGLMLVVMARLLELGAPFVTGLGLDSNAAMAIDAEGLAEVLGPGRAYLLQAEVPASACAPQQELEFGPVALHRLAAGDTAMWPGGVTPVPEDAVSATDGATLPDDPY